MKHFLGNFWGMLWIKHTWLFYGDDQKKAINPESVILHKHFPLKLQTFVNLHIAMFYQKYLQQIMTKGAKCTSHLQFL